MTFNFDDGWDSIDEAIQEVKAVIFRMPQESLEIIHPEWVAQLSCALECYNVAAKEENEDPRNIDIPKTEGQCEVQGPQIKNPDITASVKTKQVNIGTEAKPKFTKIGDYWDDMIVDKVS